MHKRVEEDSNIDIFENTIKGNFNQKKKPERVLDYLGHLLNNRSIFRFILTHPDLDHMRGIKDLFNSFKIINLWDTENQKEISDFKSEKDREDWEFYQKIRKSKHSPKVLHLFRDQSGDYWKQDGIRILSPTKDIVNEANKKKDWNMLSYVLLIEENGLKIVLAGDSTDNTWDDIINYYKDTGCLDTLRNIDVLVAPHHGRSSNSNYEFLQIMRPKLTLIGNAQSEYIDYEAYRKHSGKILTNNQAGNVVINKIGNSYYVLITNRYFAEKNHKFKELYSEKIANRTYFCLWKLK